MIFLSAQPWDQYFVWQIEVQITNFRKHNISDKMHVCVWYPGDPNTQLLLWKELENKYPEVKFFYYKDEGVNLKLYIPQLRPHILSKHFNKFPELSNKVIFYHDSDIIFNYLPDFNSLIHDEINWQSDTSGYLDYNYLRSKEIQGNIPENEAVDLLASIGNTNVNTFKAYKGRTGGAQCILKNIDGEFWKYVERQCIEIRKNFLYGQPDSINSKYFKSENAGFQSWCADMWALNMALWSRGRQTDVTKELDFSWATDNSETFLKKSIFHNAGATGVQPGVFYKGSWINRSPIGIIHEINPNLASFHYVEIINEITKNNMIS